jgi:hypothetical protein
MVVATDPNVKDAVFLGEIVESRDERFSVVGDDFSE